MNDDNTGYNDSPNTSFDTVLSGFLSRRMILKGGVSTAAMLLMGGALTACGSDDDPLAPAQVLSLNFDPVNKSVADLLTVPAGYQVNVLHRLGDPIANGVTAYANNGSESGASFAQRAGDHHDGMCYFGLGDDGKFAPNSSARGLICMNHENVTPVFLHATGQTVVAGQRTVADEVLKEINAHGVAIFEVARPAGAAAAVVTASSFNRRITPNTPMVIRGPASGNAQLKTLYAPAGATSRGTINNCATGSTPWGTFLTCEENWAGYFHRDATDNATRGTTSKAVKSLTRYGVPQGASSGNNLWSTALAADPADSTFRRWNATQNGVSVDGSDDYRNEPDTFGYVVEIDPFDPAAVPKKRTALGRLAHEAAVYGTPVAGKPLAFYMGDDSRGEYIYKFVTSALWSTADANAGASVGDKYLDTGTLHVAKFNDDGTGTWLPLTMANAAIANYANFPFTDLADICIHTRLAADAVGATKMDRPEWTAVNPKNGEVYVTLTNNNATNRSVALADAANPRSYLDPQGGRGNPNGHIIRLKETANEPAATAFTWDIFLFGARASADPNQVNVSGLTDINDFSSPDGVWFDPRGLCWIQTDDGAYTDVTNCMMLAALPGSVGDGGSRVIANTDGVTSASVTTRIGAAPSSSNLRRFLVGPKNCEITGICMTPDYKTLFVNIQHPGETYPDPTSAGAQAAVLAAPPSSWPGNAGARPRSATIVITRTDGAEVGAQLR